MESPAGGYQQGTGSVVLGSLTVPGEPEQVSAVRGFVQRTLRDMDAVDSDAATLLVSELATNAILHTKSGAAGGTVTVVVAALAEGVLIEVIDDGSAGLPSVRSDLYAAQGHGLFLVQQLAAQWGYLRDPAGTTVWFHLPGDESASDRANGGENARTHIGELGVARHVRRHRVDQVAERAKPDSGSHGRRGRGGDIHIAAQLNDPDRAEHADLSDARPPDRGLQTGPEAGLDPGDLRTPAARVTV